MLVAGTQTQKGTSGKPLSHKAQKEMVSSSSFHSQAYFSYAETTLTKPCIQVTICEIGHAMQGVKSMFLTP